MLKTHSNQHGFALAQTIAAAGLLIVAGTIGYASINGVFLGKNSGLKSQTTNILNQAAYSIISESTDVDGDGYPESAAQAAGTLVPTSGGVIPSSSSAPKTDSWGTNIGYCSWDNGSTNTSTNRITGDNPAGSSSIVFALISAGPDKVFQTSCAQARTGSYQGDDGVRFVSVTQIQQGGYANSFWKEPVADLTELNAIPAGNKVVGETRLVLALSAFYRWDGTNWIATTGSGSSGTPWKDSVANSSSLPSSGNTTGDVRLVADVGILYAWDGSKWTPISQTGSVYSLTNSIYLDNPSAQFFSRTPAVIGNQKAWTWSGWVKRNKLGVEQTLLGTDNSNNIRFNTTDNLVIENYSGAGADYALLTTQVFRDTAAWYHIVEVWDSNNSSSTDRQRLYVNGTRVTVGTLYNAIPLGALSKINSNILHGIGSNQQAGAYLDGYLSDVNFIDGQALDASYFGKTDPSSNQWVPKSYTGTYGTNGYRLSFSNSTNLGTDTSGNNNSWALNAITSVNQVIDTPLNNYCTLNYLAKSSANANIGKGGTKFANGGLYQWDQAAGTMKILSTGKWAFMFKELGGIGPSDYSQVGISLNGRTGSMTNPALFYSDYHGHVYLNGTQITSTPTYLSVGDYIEYLIDSDANTVTLRKNGVTTLATVTLDFTANELFPVYSAYAAGGEMHFGANPAIYTPPSGYQALNTQNLPTPAIVNPKQYFNTVTWTGNGSTQSVTGVGFKPDLYWHKSRTEAYSHTLLDSVRGFNLLATNNSNAETLWGGFTSFDTDGFTVNNTTGDNTNGAQHVAWNWKKGATPGFDIVTFTGNGSNSQVIPHSLGVTPAMIIYKGRNLANNWTVAHKGLGNMTSTVLLLNSSGASTALTNAVPAPTATNFGASLSVAGNGNTHVAYLFSEVSGFSKFGSYTGNGSTNGPFVWTGFKPAYVMIKCTSIAGSDWIVLDTARDSFNTVTKALITDGAQAELASYGTDDFVSNGFMLRDANGGTNSSGATYIYAAFASAPFKYANAR